MADLKLTTATRFISICLIAFGGTAMAAQQQSITILFTGDRHGNIEPWLGWEEPLRDKTVGGMDRLASVADEVRAQVDKTNVLLLDAGDAIGERHVAR